MIKELQQKVKIRNAVGGDGVRIWELIRTHGGLDLNSAYCYMMFCHHHAQSCYIADVKDKLAGFVTSYFLPQHPKTLFVWQVGVNPEFRGQGIASQLLDKLAGNHPGIFEINTTIEPSNTASVSLFSSFAGRNDFSINSKKFIRAEDFPESASHADEDLFILRKEKK